MRRVRRAAVAVLLAMPLLAAGVAQAETPRPARDFTQSICVNGHLSYWNWSYGYYQEVVDRLRELGVSCFRDGISPRAIDGTAYDLAGRLDYLGDHGIRLNLIVGFQQRGANHELEIVDDPADTVAMIRRRISNVEAVEGLNEPDVGSYSGDWWNVVRGHQRRLWEAAKDHYRVLAPTLVFPWDWRCPERADGRCRPGDSYDLGQYAHFATMHNYPGGRAPKAGREYGGVRFNRRESAWRVAPGKPVRSTEWGYHNTFGCGWCKGAHPPASRRAAGRWTIIGHLEHLRQGVDRTFLYELADGWTSGQDFDQMDCCWGLYESWDRDGDGQMEFGRPKPAAIVLRNWNRLLETRGGAVKPRPLTYSVSDPLGRVKSMLLQKPDGSRWIALWQTEGDTVARRVRLTLDRRHTVHVYRPDRSTRGRSLGRGRRLAFRVGSDPVLVKVR